MGLSGPRSNKPVFVGSSAGGQAGGGLWRAHGAVKPGVGGGWRVGAGVLSSVFLLEQELESGPLYPKSSPASSKHPHSSHCECFPGASRRCVSSSTEPVSCSLSLSRPLSFDFHLQNSRWPLSPPFPHPSPVLHRRSQLLQLLEAPPFLAHSPASPHTGRRTRGFPLGTGAGEEGSLAWFPGSPSQGASLFWGPHTPVLALIWERRTLESRSSSGQLQGRLRQEACHRHLEGRPQGAVAARSSGWEEGWAWIPSSGLS